MHAWLSHLTHLTYITTFGPHNKVLNCWELPKVTQLVTVRGGTPTPAFGFLCPHPFFFPRLRWKRVQCCDSNATEEPENKLWNLGGRPRVLKIIKALELVTIDLRCDFWLYKPRNMQRSKKIHCRVTAETKPGGNEKLFTVSPTDLPTAKLRTLGIKYSFIHLLIQISEGVQGALGWRSAPCPCGVYHRLNQ